jgi:hypothetical protein
MRWVAAAAASVVPWAAVELGTFVPLASASGLEYLYVWPGARRLVVASAIGAALIAAAYAAVLAFARQSDPETRRRARAGEWLAPLSATSLWPLGTLPAWPGVGEVAAPVSYFFYDLRHWWLGVLLACCAWRVVRLSPAARRVSTRFQSLGSSAASPLVVDGLIFFGVMAWAIVTTPHLRFSGALTGDEPKYIRYCETWYQGRGMDVSRNVPFAKLPRNAPSNLTGNLRLFVSAVGANARALAADLGAFARDPVGFRWNRLTGSGGFYVSKWGTGSYQLHQPGLSAVLFPGYYVDRHWLSARPGYQGEFPADLPMTSLTLLVVYGLAAVLLFRVLRRVLGGVAPAALASSLAMMTLPTSAFPFQFYPELPALALLLSVGLVVGFAPRAGPSELLGRPRAAFWTGIAAGGLMWLHPRFVLLSVTLAAVGFWHARGRARTALGGGWGLVAFSVGAYNYHVTGSWFPNAFYSAPTDVDSLALSRVLDNLIAYGLHARLGLIAQAPWLLAVIPGFALLWRADRRAAGLLAAVVLALGVPASAYALNPAGGTPGRFVLAVVPLLVWPAAWFAVRCWASTAVRIGTLVVLVLSLEAALTYNWHVVKGVGTFIGSGSSGWRPHLVFPEVRRHFAVPAEPGVAVAAAIVAVMAIATVWALGRGVREGSPRRGRSSGLVAALVVASVVGLSVLSTLAVGRPTHRDYRLPDPQARNAAAAALVSLDRCRVCFTTLDPQVDWRWLAPNPAGTARVEIGQDGRSVVVDVDLGGQPGQPGFGQTRLQFGDGSSRIVGVVGQARIVHRYASPGVFRLIVAVDGPRETTVRGATLSIEGKQ